MTFLPIPEIVPLDWPGRRLMLRATTQKELVYRAKCCEKEPWTCAFIEAMPTGSVLYDVGACVGSYTLIAAALGHMVVAVEPAYTNYQALCYNLALNDLLGSAIVLPVALGAETRIDLFQYRSLTQGDASHFLGRQPGGAPRWHHQQPVPVWRLDDLIQAFRLPAPTHLKIDVDGGELPVLAGMAKALDMVQGVIVELHPETEPAALKCFAEHGLLPAERFGERGGKPLVGVVYVRLART